MGAPNLPSSSPELGSAVEEVANRNCGPVRTGIERPRPCSYAHGSTRPRVVCRTSGLGTYASTVTQSASSSKHCHRPALADTIFSGYKIRQTEPRQTRGALPSKDQLLRACTHAGGQNIDIVRSRVKLTDQHRPFERNHEQIDKFYTAAGDEVTGRRWGGRAAENWRRRNQGLEENDERYQPTKNLRHLLSGCSQVHARAFAVAHKKD